MFFCEECKHRNDWPGIWAFSYGNCEVCGTRAPCYDVPSKHLPVPKSGIVQPPLSPKPKREINKLVHLSHCCQKHGCKYSNSNCPVLKTGGQLYMCEQCSEEVYEEGGWEDAHLLNEMFDRGRKNAYTEIRQIGN